MLNNERIGVQIPQILLPKHSTDLSKWAVIACDQFTSQPEYWEAVENTVGDAPSTLRMILPEAHLHDPNVKEQITAIHRSMQKYLDDGTLQPFEGLVLVERQIGDATQTGLIVALDLENYDFNKGSQTLIRATEGTILDRLPPRMDVRRAAPLELPHILVLYDDPEFTVLDPLLEKRPELDVLYDLELMQGSGHLKGYAIQDQTIQQATLDALESLISPENYAQRYDIKEVITPLLFAMGDGNHSLATAKAIWEEVKADVGEDHPARYALVELVNLHDPSLKFEAIHRVLFNVPGTFLDALKENFGSSLKVTPAEELGALEQAVLNAPPIPQSIGMITPTGNYLLEWSTSDHNLPVGTLQAFLDSYLKAHPEVKIDYVHGDDVVATLGAEPGNTGFFLAPIKKDAFFKSVIVDGSLPRKTFSMGHAENKRFYLECRKIT